MRLATGAVLALVALCAACTSSKPDSDAGSSASLPAGRYKLGNPYQINGRWYRPQYDPSYSRTGTASWYGDDFHGKPTANGELFDKNLITAAHPTLPLPSQVRVTNLDNGRTIELRVNDRGPFVGDRLIDLSEAAARELGYDRRGLANVRVDFLDLAEARGPRPVPSPVPSMVAIPPPPVVRIETPVYAGPALPPGRPVQVAAIDGPQARQPMPPSAPVCVTAGPQWVQVGAFSDTTRLHLAANSLDEVGTLRIEPVMVQGQAAIRLRLGPAPDSRSAAQMLGEVRRKGYGDAFLVPVNPGPATRVC